MSLSAFTAFGQIYQWSGNPNWIASGGLAYRTPCNVVTTNCNGNYTNNLDEYYTSPTINTVCNNASTVNVTFDIIGNAEFNYDAIFFEYSINNGSTWILIEGWTGNFATLTTLGYILPTSPTFKWRFNFYSDWSGRASGYKLSNFKINCNVVLPIELITFDGNCDGFKWSTGSELNNAYFEIEKTIDGNTWETIARIEGQGTKNTISDYAHEISLDGLSYYRLTQTDLNGTKTYFDAISIECDNPKESIYFDMMGKQVNPDNLSSGMYLKVTGKIVEKIML